MTALAIIAVAAAYLLGSVPSAYILGRVWGKVDLRREGEGHVSATAVYRNVGLLAFIVAIIMDLAKAMAAIYLARVLTDSLTVTVIAAYAMVIGHCWSVFLRFNGGLGAVVIYGSLFFLTLLRSLPQDFFIAAAIGAALMYFTRKSKLSTYVLVAVVSIILFIQRERLILVLYPLGLIAIQTLRQLQIRRKSAATGYTNEIFNDLKRLR